MTNAYRFLVLSITVFLGPTARRFQNHADLHARGDPPVAADPPRHASGETGARQARDQEKREAKEARDLHAALEKVRQSAEIVVEEGYRTAAVIKPVQGPGRRLDECIALAKAQGSGATLDGDVAKDLEEIIAQRRPLDTSAWD